MKKSNLIPRVLTLVSLVMMSLPILNFAMANPESSDSANEVQLQCRLSVGKSRGEKRVTISPADDVVMAEAAGFGCGATARIISLDPTKTMNDRAVITEIRLKLPTGITVTSKPRFDHFIARLDAKDAGGNSLLCACIVKAKNLFGPAAEPFGSGADKSAPIFKD